MRTKKIRLRIFTLLLLMFVAIFLTACKEDRPVVRELDTRYTDSLELLIPFEGKSYLAHGIGEVELINVVDGDTIKVKGLDENVRFLGVDTPESTARIEPWGYAAADFVREKLTSAESIVLQKEGELTDSNGRYLAWVWYKPVGSDKYRLLNLELIENAYSRFTMGESMYYDILLKAHDKTEVTELRIFGEKNDPDFEYSRTPVETTVFEALENHHSYKAGTRFKFKVQIVRIVGNNLFVRDVEVDSDKVGHIYVYTGFGADYYNYVNPGDIITLEAQLQYEGQFGTQLTGVRGITKVGSADIDIREIDANTLEQGGWGLEPYYGEVVKLTNMTLSKVSQSRNDAKKNYYNLEFTNSRGEIISVRLAPDKSQYTRDQLVEGSMYTVIGGISSYEFATNYYQVVVGEKDKTIIPDLQKVN